MTAMQELKIFTKNGREFCIQLELCSPNRFECKLAYVSGFNANSVFYPSEKGESVYTALESLMSEFNKKLFNDDPSDLIVKVNNITTELITIDEQKKIFSENVVITVSGSYI